jgi:hypothetical protein
MVNKTTRDRPLRTIWRLLCLLVFTFDWSGGSVADGLKPTYLDQLFQDSDLVVEVQVDAATRQSVNGSACGTKYTAAVLESYKVGRHLGDPHIIEFGRYHGLEVGQRYFVFLNFEGSAESIYDEIVSDPILAEALRSDPTPKGSALELIRCNGIVPGLMADPKFSWIVSGPEVIVPPDVLLQVPEGVRVDATDGTAYYLRSSDLSAYLRDLGSETN